MTNKKPLILVNHRSPLSSSGRPSGIAYYMQAITRGLLERDNFDVGLVTSWRKEDLPNDIRSRLKSYTHQPLVRPRVFDVIKQALVMPRLARQLRADLILNVDPIGSPRGATTRITVVHDMYQKVLPEAFSKREQIFNDLIIRMMTRGSDAVICASDQTKADLDRYYPQAARKTRRIYGDTGVTVAVEHSKAFANERPGHLLWVGKITANKNIACLYKALRTLADRGELIPTVIVGDDVFNHANEASRVYGAGLAVNLAGRVSNSELAELYAKAICFVNTSTYEGFGMPVIEAQRMGIPVICSSGGAVSEVAGEGALVFDPSEPQQLAEHISSVFGSLQLRERLVELGNINAAKFSWDKTAAEVEELARECLMKNGRSDYSALAI